MTARWSQMAEGSEEKIKQQSNSDTSAREEIKFIAGP